MRCRHCHSTRFTASRRTGKDILMLGLLPVKPHRCSACGNRRYSFAYLAGFIQLVAIGTITVGLMYQVHSADAFQAPLASIDSGFSMTLLTSEGAARVGLPAESTLNVAPPVNLRLSTRMSKELGTAQMKETHYPQLASQDL